MPLNVRPLWDIRLMQMEKFKGLLGHRNIRLSKTVLNEKLFGIDDPYVVYILFSSALEGISPSLPPAALSFFVCLLKKGPPQQGPCMGTTGGSPPC